MKRVVIVDDSPAYCDLWCGFLGDRYPDAAAVESYNHPYDALPKIDDSIDLLIYMAKQEASDLHLKPMRPPLVRIRGKLIPIKTEPLKPADLEKMLLPILNRPQREKFDQLQSVDFGYGVPGVARFRANLYMQRGTVGAVFRRVPIQIKGLDELE